MRAFIRQFVGVALLLMVSASGAQAQQADDGWKVTLAPYLMAAGMSGTTGIGPLDSDVDMSASDVFKNLRVGGMGYFEVMKGPWGFGVDAIWMSLESEGGNLIPTTVQTDQGAFTVVGIRRLGAAANLRFGAVINRIRPAIEFGAPINLRRSRPETWVDPIVGINLHTPDTGGRWGFALMADVGGFGVGSDVMTNIEPIGVFRFTQSVGLTFGYRWIYVNYENEGDANTSRFLYDVASTGPLVGLVFRF